ncbi:MAG: hypothetical protein WCF67_20040, partial [Chitinophagaceae bacterium]
ARASNYFSTPDNRLNCRQKKRQRYLSLVLLLVVATDGWTIIYYNILAYAIAWKKPFFNGIMKLFVVVYSLK